MATFVPVGGFGYFNVRQFRAERGCPEEVHEERLCKAADIWWWHKTRDYKCPYTKYVPIANVYRVNPEDFSFLEDCCRTQSQVVKQLAQDYMEQKEKEDVLKALGIGALIVLGLSLLAR